MTDTVLPVPADWKRHAFLDKAKYDEMYARSIADPEGFWGEQAARIDWIKPFTKVKNVSWNPDNLFIKWFEDGTLNVTANCIDRHLTAHADRVAIIWEGDDPSQSKAITYRSCTRKSAASPMCCAAMACKRVTASRSTCR